MKSLVDFIFLVKSGKRELGRFFIYLFFYMWVVVLLIFILLLGYLERFVFDRVM